jgi:hypothetical protein
MLEFLDGNTIGSISNISNGRDEPSARLSTPFGFVIAVLEASELLESNLHGGSSQVTNVWMDLISISCFDRDNWKYVN